MSGVVVNGRFRTAHDGGFRRYAERITERLELDVITPDGPAHGLRGRTWEQTVLARRTADRTLWSPIGAGPVHHPDHVVTVHDLAALDAPADLTPAARRVTRLLTLPTIRRARAVTTVSTTSADAIRRHTGRTVDLVSPPGIDDRFHRVAAIDRAAARHHLARATGRSELDTDRPLVGGFVSDVPRKRGADLVHVLEQVADATGALAVTIGFDGTATVFASGPRARSVGVVDLGAVDDGTATWFVRALDVVVAVPRHEGFAMPLVEAAAAGTAVVTTPTPSVRDHLAGHVVEIDRPAAAPAAAIRLLTEPRRRDELAAAARAAVTPLRWSRTAADLAEVLGVAPPPPLNVPPTLSGVDR